MANKHRIVILGGGFAGLYAALELEESLLSRPDVEVTLVNRENFFLFTPMLHEVAAGDLDLTNIVNPARKLLRNVSFFEGQVRGIDLHERRVIVEHGFDGHTHELEFDQIVLALGSTTQFFGLPGVEENALTMKSLSDAVKLRNRLIAILEEADTECCGESRLALLSVTVAGAAPNPRELLVLGWGGMRGVLSLAAAFSVPYSFANGVSFEQRSMIVYLTFCLIVTSLVLQGLTMPSLIRLLAIDSTNDEEREERHARRRLVEDVLRHLSRRRVQERFDAAVVTEMSSMYERRLQALPIEELEGDETGSRVQRDALLLEILQVERESLIRLRNEAAISDDVARAIQRDLDLLESHVHTGSAPSILAQHL